MLVVLSPAKTQDFESARTLKTHEPLFQKKIATLIKKLKSISATDITQLMSISPKLAELNYQRFQNFDSQHYTKQNSKAAILAYQGDVYQGLDAASLSDDDLYFADQHLLILSGLYGAVRPLDLIQAYRLEMGIKLKTDQAKDLYAFWQTSLNDYINEQLKTEKTLINLASEEYSKVIDTKKLQGQLIKIEFQDILKGKYQVVGIKAKKARGTMARFIIKHRIKDPSAIQNFTEEGYHFVKALSNPKHFIFQRG